MRPARNSLTSLKPARPGNRCKIPSKNFKLAAVLSCREMSVRFARHRKRKNFQIAMIWRRHDCGATRSNKVASKVPGIVAMLEKLEAHNHLECAIRSGQIVVGITYFEPAVRVWSVCQPNSAFRRSTPMSSTPNFEVLAVAPLPQPRSRTRGRELLAKLLALQATSSEGLSEPVARDTHSRRSVARH